MAIFPYQRNAIDEERLRSVLNILSLGHPRMRETWERNQANFAPAYRDYINDLIAEMESRPSTDQVSSTKGRSKG